MKIKNIILFIVLVMLIVGGFYYRNCNLIFTTEKEKESIKESIYIDKNVQSFDPISYTESILGFNGDNVKILIFNVSKNDYTSDNLNYSDENIDGLPYGTNKVDMGDYYRCKIKLANFDITKSDYENLNPFSKVGFFIEIIYNIVIVFILINLFVNKKKKKIIIIVLALVIILLLSCLFYYNNTNGKIQSSIDNSLNNSFLKEKN